MSAEGLGFYVAGLGGDGMAADRLVSAVVPSKESRLPSWKRSCRVQASSRLRWWFRWGRRGEETMIPRRPEWLRLIEPRKWLRAVVPSTGRRDSPCCRCHRDSAGNSPAARDV